jgi:hypothetical protein
MRAAWQYLLARLQQFRLVEDAVAAVEFALVVPIMLVLYIGSVEVSLLIAMDRKVQSVAGALGDLVARSDREIREDDLADYFLAAAGIMTPHPTLPLHQTVTQVEVHPDDTTTVVWSREYHNGVVRVGERHLKNAEFNLPREMRDVARDNFVIVAEGSYAYPPLYGFAFDKTINLYRANFFIPRFGDSIDIK